MLIGGNISAEFTSNLLAPLFFDHDIRRQIVPSYFLL